MKWIIVLTIFLALTIINVDGQCDLGTEIEFDPTMVRINISRKDKYFM